MLRDNYEEVQVLGFYDSPEDYVAGNLQSQAFEHVEEEEPFEGDMNKQYNTELIDEEEYSESEDYSLSPDDADDVRIVPDNKKSFDKQSVSAASSSEKMMRRQSRNY